MINEIYKIRIRRFFLISHSLPFVITIIVMIISKSFIITNPILGKLLYIGFISPTLAALYIVYKYYSKDEIRNYWYSMIDFKRISVKWWLFIVLFPFTLRLLASIFDSTLGFNGFIFYISPTMTIGYALLLLPFGPIPEEIGWRGVVLPDLVNKHGFIKAVITLGLMWCLWHIPMFFVEGTYHNNLGILTPLFFNYFAQAFFTSIILAVIYFKTNRSILAVIIFHYFSNLMGETMEMTNEALVIETCIRGMIAIYLLIVFYKSIDSEFKKNIFTYHPIEE